MDTKTPRIAAVTANDASELLVTWKDGRFERVNLAGWIATGDDILAPLAAPSVFGHPKVGDYGASVVWDWDGDELAIDTVHLELLAQEQRPFEAADAAAWQSDVGMSNQEAADFLGVTVSTWHTYKNGAARIPSVVAMVCRVSRRDPVLMQAHYRPRKAGRPDSLKIADRLRILIATRPNLTEAELAREIFGADGYQQKVNATCRLLEARGEVERHGQGGPGEPFRYRLAGKKTA